MEDGDGAENAKFVTQGIKPDRIGPLFKLIFCVNAFPDPVKPGKTRSEHGNGPGSDPETA